MKLISLICLLASTVRFCLGIKNPIILFPGLGGSQMEVSIEETAEIDSKCITDSTDFFTIWLNLKYSLSHTPKCMFDAISLIYNVEARKTDNLPGISTRVKGFGLTENTEYVDSTTVAAPYLKELVKTMIKEGYISGESIRAAAYDFRKGPNELAEYFEQLKALIEETYEKNEKKKVVIVNHSLGALVSLVFLRQQSQEWKDQYIQYQISLGAAWAGAVRSMAGYINGYSVSGTEFFPKVVSSFLSDLPITLPEITLIPKETVRTFPATIWLFPTSAAWKTTDELVRMNDKSYTLGNMEEFFRDLEEPSGWEIYKDLQPFMNDLSEPGVDLYCLYGIEVETVATAPSNDHIWDSFRSQINGDGDGTVNLQSLELCNKWIGGKKKVTIQTFVGVNHGNIISNSEVLDYIVNLIRTS